VEAIVLRSRTDNLVPFYGKYLLSCDAGAYTVSDNALRQKSDTKNTELFKHNLILAKLDSSCKTAKF